MIKIGRGQENVPGRLDWFVTLGGAPFDPAEIAFQIKLNAGDVQVFPATPGEWADATPGQFGPGAFFAFDSGAGAGWTPDGAASTGDYTISWRVKLRETSGYVIATEAFKVVAYAADADPLYVSVEEIRALGIPATITDATLEATIRLWQEFLCRACRQWFHPIQMEMTVDGTDSDAIHFGVPIIDIAEVRLNNDSAALDPGLYKVYNSQRYPYDRHNPRVKLVDSWADRRDIFTASDRRLRFRHGRQNQYFRGTFGCIESNGEPPALIKRALSKLVIEKLATPIYAAPGACVIAPPPVLAGIVVEEETDGHRVEYAPTNMKSRAPGLYGITNDQEVLNIIKLYKAPIGVATPSNPSYS